jgi:hypothetical protein
MKLMSIVFLNLLAVQAFASSWESLVERLTKTRAELESLSQEVDSVQKEKQSNLDQLLMRKSDLDTQVEREKLRRLQLTEKLKRLEGRVKISSQTDPKAQEKLQTWITNLEGSVQKNIPFETEQRLQTLTRLKERVLKNHEPMEFILADLWNFVESEFKLAQTNEYKIITLDLDGNKKKCEVARLGLMSMFVVTPDGKIRRALKKETEWQWQEIHPVAQQNSILALVKNLKNKTNVEIYQLPIQLDSQFASELFNSKVPRSAFNSNAKEEVKNSVGETAIKSTKDKSKGVHL